MSKSIRSKWKRKCRAVKRERYAAKELIRLKKMLGIKEEENKSDKEVIDSENVIFLDANKVKELAKKDVAEEESDVEMSSDDEKVAVAGSNGKTRTFSTKTLKDQNGQYPIWFHKRKIAKINKVAKKNLKKRSKKRKR